MRKFLNELMSDRKLLGQLYQPDILMVTSPCNGRTVLRDELGIPRDFVYSEDELFAMQAAIIRLLRPRRVISEMTPPNSEHHRDHYQVAREIYKCGYDVTVTDRFPRGARKEGGVKYMYCTVFTYCTSTLNTAL